MNIIVHSHQDHLLLHSHQDHFFLIVNYLYIIYVLYAFVQQCTFLTFHLLTSIV